MEENRFFRTIWRINAVTLMLLIIALGGIALYSYIVQIIREKPPAIITNVADYPNNEENS